MTCFGYFTCEIAAVARRACPVGRGVEGGRREKMRWFRPPFQCGREDSARETQERSWSGFVRCFLKVISFFYEHVDDKNV